jgi:hypothetical protein
MAVMGASLEMLIERLALLLQQGMEAEKAAFPRDVDVPIGYYRGNGDHHVQNTT